MKHHMATEQAEQTVKATRIEWPADAEAGESR